MKIYILVNPVAGNGQAKKVCRETQQILQQKHIEYRIYNSLYPGHLTILAKKFADHYSDLKHLLLIIGGDGSLNQVVNGIKKSSNPATPLAFLSAGTGNDFARAAKSIKNPASLIEDLLHHLKVTPVNCGKVTNDGRTQYFVNNLGVGFDASVVRASNHAKLKKVFNHLGIGKLIYAFNVFHVLRTQDAFSVEIKVNQTTHDYQNVYFVTTTNHPYFGGGLAILPAANIHSGLLDIVIVEKPSLGKFIRLFIHLLRDGSQINAPEFHYFAGKNIELKTFAQEYGQIDGEEITKQKFHLKFQIAHFKLIY